MQNGCKVRVKTSAGELPGTLDDIHHDLGLADVLLDATFEGKRAVRVKLADVIEVEEQRPTTGPIGNWARI